MTKVDTRSRLALLVGLSLPSCGASDAAAPSLAPSPSTAGTANGGSSSTVAPSASGSNAVAGSGGGVLIEPLPSAGLGGGGSESRGGGTTAGSGGGAGASTSVAGTSAVDPGTAGDGEFKVGPDYPKSPDLTVKNLPQGRVFDFTLASKDSQFFTGNDTTLLSKRTFTRAIKVYVPAKYQDGQAAPLFVIHDGPKQFDIAKIAVDNLSQESSAARRLPAFVIVSIANGGGDDKGSERGLEYDTMSDRYVSFVEGEVLPAVLKDSAVKAAYPKLAFTTDPEGRATMGCSSGGAAAFTMGWFRPDLYRRILTYSGTFVDQQDDDAAEEKLFPLGAWEYHSGMSLIANAERKPLRVFVSTNESDIGNAEPETGHHNWVIANQRMAAAFKAKGYHYRYLFGANAGHAPVKLQENTLPEALLWLWRGYPN